MKIGSWSSRGPAASLLLLAAVTLCGLVPFLGKAVHIDDPLFIWSARHIVSHPLDFYGFPVNWDGRTATMAAVTENPPLCSYYMALIGSCFGWSELALHAGFLLPALASVWGTYLLARRLCAHPVWAAVMLAVSPGFLLCSTGMMCDTLMLAFWVWAVFFWIEGLSTGRGLWLALAVILASAAALTKYFGISLVPLLAVYALLEHRRGGAWLAWLSVPLVALGLFHSLTIRLYGHSLVVRALIYATHLRVGGQLPSKLLAGFAFVGGCFVLPLVAAPWLWNRKQLLAGGGAAVLAGLLVIAMKQVGQASMWHDGHVNGALVAQIAVLSVSGASLLAVAVADGLERATAASALLLLWVLGTLVFTCLLNWTVSGRNILPLLPAAAILLARRLESRQARSGHKMNERRFLLAPAFSLAIGLMAAHADFEGANSARLAAATLTQQLDGRARAIKFEGHWGFQYYMQLRGAIPLDRERPEFASNDAIIIPVGNSYLFSLPPQQVEPWFGFRTPACRWLTVMNLACGAGFYSDGWGPLPFVFGPVPPEEYYVYRVR